MVHSIQSQMLRLGILLDHPPIWSLVISTSQVLDAKVSISPHLELWGSPLARGISPPYSGPRLHPQAPAHLPIAGKDARQPGPCYTLPLDYSNMQAL